MQLELKGFTLCSRSLYHDSAELFRSELEHFVRFGTSTIVGDLAVDSGQTISIFTNEFWTSKQRAASSLHEVSYRACFKPQLPRFFIERLTNLEISSTIPCIRWDEVTRDIDGSLKDAEMHRQVKVVDAEPCKRKTDHGTTSAWRVFNFYGEFRVQSALSGTAPTISSYPFRLALCKRGR